MSTDFRAHPGSEFAVVNTLAKWKKLEPNEIDFSQGFSQKVVSIVVSISRSVFNSLLASGNFCYLLVYLENINLILAFIINIISQSVGHLNISSASIVCSNTEMHVILYTTVNVYTAIIISYSLGYLSGSVDRTREFITFLFLSTAL